MQQQQNARKIKHMSLLIWSTFEKRAASIWEQDRNRFIFYFTMQMPFAEKETEIVNEEKILQNKMAM